jgi:hypothetical protein
MDYLKLYDLERYLFDDVTTAFRINRKLSAFEFFCIIIWKANRAKSKIALKLLAHDTRAGNDLNTIVEHLTSEIAKAQDDGARMRILNKDWEFRLPMASAILTVLYPNSFTVYDVRVCDELQNHHNVQHKTRFDHLWAGYQKYLADVRSKEPTVSALRARTARCGQSRLRSNSTTIFPRSSRRTMTRTANQSLQRPAGVRFSQFVAQWPAAAEFRC